MTVEVREVCNGLWAVALDDRVIFRGPKPIAQAVARANCAVIEEREARENGEDVDIFAKRAA